MKKMTEEQKQHYKSLILMLMTRHIGRANKIGMGELFEAVFEAPWANRINDTRPLRKLVTELRRDGVPICSSAEKGGGGYWLASAGSELIDYCAKLKSQALKKLSQMAKFMDVSLPELLGQMRVDMEVKSDG